MSTLPWYEKPVRMMRWEYMQNVSRLREMDLDKLARMKKEQWHINCEWIVGTPGAAPGTGYLTAFEAEGFERYPGLENFDCVREYLPYAHKYGIRLLVYLNMHWYSYQFADKNPGWEQMVSSGHSYGRIHPLYGDGTTFCVNSPWRDWAFRLIKETAKTGADGVFLDGPIFFPGCCYCPYCQEKFKKIYTQDIPKEENWTDNLWKDFIEFRGDSLAEFLMNARNALKEINSEGIIFLNAGGWQPHGWRYARDIEKMGKHQDFNGAEEFFHPKAENNILANSMMAKYLSAGNKPAIVFNHYAMGSWHYTPLPPLEIKLALAQIIAHRANPWICVFDPLAKNAGAEEPVAEILEFAEQNEEYYEKISSVSKVALHFSRQASSYYLSQLESLYQDIGSGKEEGLVLDQGTGKVTVDWAKRKSINESLLHNAYLGYYLSLTRSHILFDVILDEHLSLEPLKQYEVLILPNSACLSNNQREAIKGFVKQGGKLLASLETGFYDEKGNPVKDKEWMDLLGIAEIEGLFPPVVGENYLVPGEEFAGFQKERLIERPVQALKIRQKTGVRTPLFYMEPIPKVYMPLGGKSTYPALLINNYGEGESIYSSSLLEAFYGEYRIESSAQLISEIVKMLLPEDAIKVEAPCTVEVAVYYQEEFSRYLLHLVNSTGDTQRPLKEIIPIHDIKVSLRVKPVRRVYQVNSNNQPIPFICKNGEVEFLIPELKLYKLIVAEV